MSILSADMAYSNARLIGQINMPWLQKLAPSHGKLEAALAHKLSPILKLFEFKLENEDKMESFLFAFFQKYGKIKFIQIGLNSLQNEDKFSSFDNSFSATVIFANSHCVIDAYNACMDMLNRGQSLCFKVDFVLIKEMHSSHDQNMNETQTTKQQQQQNNAF